VFSFVTIEGSIQGLSKDLPIIHLFVHFFYGVAIWNTSGTCSYAIR